MHIEGFDRIPRLIKKNARTWPTIRRNLTGSSLVLHYPAIPPPRSNRKASFRAGSYAVIGDVAYAFGIEIFQAHARQKGKRNYRFTKKDSCSGRETRGAALPVRQMAAGRVVMQKCDKEAFQRMLNNFLTATSRCQWTSIMNPESRQAPLRRYPRAARNPAIPFLIHTIYVARRYPRAARNPALSAARWSVQL